MYSFRIVSRSLTLVCAVLVAGVVAAGDVRAEEPPLELYTVPVDSEMLQSLLESGRDVVATRKAESGLSADVVLDAQGVRDLEALGLAPAVWRNPEGLTATQIAELEQQQGYVVFRPYDGPDGLHAELVALTEEHPEVAKRVPIGTSVQDREILAIKVTKDATTVEDGSRPAVLFSSTQHAREWISTEVNRRLLHHFVEGYSTDPDIAELLEQVEIWFVVVANPDGYEFTFGEGARLWRKNLRDNNGDGEISGGEGVDLNRNFDAHWNYDQDGSSGNPGSETYRGSAAASEPETVAMQSLLARLPFTFQVNYHSYGNLLLYPLGWQDQTPSVDDPIFKALSGDVSLPAIPNFEPMLSAGLYITNGETCDHAYAAHGTLCWTPELSDGGSGQGFRFPDDEALVQAEFESNLPFALDVVKSAPHPDAPVSHLGNVPPRMVPTTFEVSYGDPQIVEVNAARSLDEVMVRYSINGGAAFEVETEEWSGGEKYGTEGSVFYHRLRGEVSGARPGDEVTVSFVNEDGEIETEPFTYRLASDTDRQVLVVAAEDYTGAAPVYPDADGPRYLDFYLDALAANGIEADAYDIDAWSRTPPSPLGVLNHYDAVIWYTGDDIVTRERDMSSAQVSQAANTAMLAMRDYLNEGGRLLYTGKYAGYQYEMGMAFNPNQDAPCDEGGCAQLSNDFMQYYMNTYDWQRAHDARVDIGNDAGTGNGWWSGSEGRADDPLEWEIDLTSATAPITLTMQSTWSIEPEFDYGYVEVRQGEEWMSIPDLGGELTNENPRDRNEGWGLTGTGRGTLAFDLSAYAGTTLQIRLRYSTDRGLELAGWFIDDLRVQDTSGAIWEDSLENGVGDYSPSGAWTTVPIAPPADFAPEPVVGVAEPFSGLEWSFGGPGESNQDHAVTQVATSRFMPADEYPQFASRSAGRYDAPGTGPRSGDMYLYSEMTTYSYQRVTRTFDLTNDDSGWLKFWLAHDVLDPYDAIFVEARPVGTDEWDTLPDENGHTSPETALNCASSSWFGRNPQLAHYMAVEGDGDEQTCVPQGTTGSWHAATGSSAGWQEWEIDLGRYAGQTVEVSIAYVSSYLQTPGVMIDDVSASTGHETSFEYGLDGWTIPGAPEGSPVNDPDFFLASSADFPLGAITVSEDTIYFGFGVEGIVDSSERAAVLGRAVDYLLRDVAPRQSFIFLPALSNRD